MKKIYYLKTCSTCIRIIKELGLQDKGFELQDIKTAPVTPLQLEEMKAMTGNYESLFSRSAMKFRLLGLDKKELSEKQYKQFILEEYTFLKRPVIIVNERIFIGNSKQTIAEAKTLIG